MINEKNEKKSSEKNKSRDQVKALVTELLNIYMAEKPQDMNLYSYILDHADPKLLEIITDTCEKQHRSMFRHGRF